MQRGPVVRCNNRGAFKFQLSRPVAWRGCSQRVLENGNLGQVTPVQAPPGARRMLPRRVLVSLAMRLNDMKGGGGLLMCGTRPGRLSCGPRHKSAIEEL
ncbi:hypothetical protein NDU88_001392 [Pleurodeles waltl]|uniref:Uncharacterized protein n=1 Tax=Pleurodeles waltl TaxID=8319 RepID=A0AAV7WM07_PLEWA|nr:hypothetical protein NDU88_001392 [Pleurodeles waltl]